MEACVRERERELGEMETYHYANIRPKIKPNKKYKYCCRKKLKNKKNNNPY